MKPSLKAPGSERLKLKYYGLLSSVAFNFSLRRYILVLAEILRRPIMVYLPASKVESPQIGLGGVSQGLTVHLYGRRPSIINQLKKSQIPVAPPGPICVGGPSCNPS